MFVFCLFICYNIVVYIPKGYFIYNFLHRVISEKRQR